MARLKKSDEVLQEIESLPDDYSVQVDIPSSFNLGDAMKKKDNPLMNYYEEEQEKSLPVPQRENKRLEDDFDEARKNIKEVLSSSSDILEEAIALAKSSDSPRAWEVVSTLMKTISDVNKDLLSIHDQKEQIKKKAADQTHHAGQLINQNNQQNNFFVGSPSELNAILSKLDK